MSFASLFLERDHVFKEEQTLLGPAVLMGTWTGLGYQVLNLKYLYPCLPLTKPTVLARPADVPGQEEKTQAQ